MNYVPLNFSCAPIFLQKGTRGNNTTTLPDQQQKNSNVEK